jgi:Fic family protein
MSILNQMDEMKRNLDAKRPFPPHTLKSIREHLIVEWTYHSNAIEGNTLTLSETKVVLEGITVGGKTLREHLEVINHREAFFYLEDRVQKTEDLTEWHMKNLHGILLKGVTPDHAGTYRKENVLISGVTHIHPDFLLVSEQMKELLKWYHGEAQRLHPVERSAILHSLFVKIHPFMDGNGRTARLLLNLELMKNGYIPTVIPKEKRARYYNSLDLSPIEENYTEFILLIAELVKDTFEFYLKLIG